MESLCRRTAIAAALFVAFTVAGQSLPESVESNPTLRTIHIPGSSMVVATWMQHTEAGDESFHSISADGVQFTEPRLTRNELNLRVAAFDPLIATPIMPARLALQIARDEPRSGRSTTAAGQESNLTSPYIVQFIAPPMDFMLSPLRELGAKPLIHIPDTSHIVEMTDAIAQQVAAMPHVRWVGPFHPGYRAEPEIIEEFSGDPSQMPTRRYSIMLFERGPVGQHIVSDRIAALGGIVHNTNPRGFRMEATLTPTQLLDVLHLNPVLFVDRWGPAGTDLNLAREIGGATPLLTGLGFTGQGVRGHVVDDGLRTTHVAFASPAPLIYGLPPSIQDHGTSTYGIVFGNGANNANGTGLLPNREQGVFTHYNQLLSQGGLMSRYDMTEDVVDPAGSYRVVFQSNSWGGPITTTYSTTSAEFDDILYLNDLLTCQSQSNTGSQLSRPEAWAKNVMSVGGIRHQNSLTTSDDAWTAASHGPAADGRVKPDLAHFYDNVMCTTGTSDTAYRTDFCCTSAATPIVCGYAGLLMQMWHEEVFDGFGGAGTVFDSRPHMATAKALLINSAFKYNWLAGGSNGNINRTKQGWGMPNFNKLHSDANRTFIVNQTDPVTPLTFQEYLLEVAPGQTEFRATMVYTDPKGNPAAGIARINDLSMKVTAPNGTFYWGNNGLNASNFSTAGGSPNSIDTVENVFIANPLPGIWTVSVFGHSIVEDTIPETPFPDVAFALVVAPVILTPCPPDLTFDGNVGTPDLLLVINAWGPCAGCPEDLDGNGSVGTADLLITINAWGPCP